ncbi:MAG: hypothetical protein QM706_09095 [Nitrospira sp.]
MIFRRPELEKDNPIAPEPYVGPRRRLAMARAASLENPAEADDVNDTLWNLVEAASRYIDCLPKKRRTKKELKELQSAIAQAERVIALGRPSELSFW